MSVIYLSCIWFVTSNNQCIESQCLLCEFLRAESILHCLIATRFVDVSHYIIFFSGKILNKHQPSSQTGNYFKNKSHFFCERWHCKTTTQKPVCQSWTNENQELEHCSWFTVVHTFRPTTSALFLFPDLFMFRGICQQKCFDIIFDHFLPSFLPLKVFYDAKLSEMSNCSLMYLRHLSVVP